MPTQKGEHSCKCTELSLKHNEGIVSKIVQPFRVGVSKWFGLVSHYIFINFVNKSLIMFTLPDYHTCTSFIFCRESWWSII